MLSEEDTRAVGEDDVAFGEAFFYGGWRGQEEDTTGAEVEEENRAVFGWELGESSVERFILEDEVKVAYDGQSWEGVWWEIFYLVIQVGCYDVQGYQEN